MVSSPYYDNPYWEFHLPVNPPGFRTDEDVVLDYVDIANWLDDDGVYRFYPRLPRVRNVVQLVGRTREALDGEADELDIECCNDFPLCFCEHFS